MTEQARIDEAREKLNQVLGAYLPYDLRQVPPTLRDAVRLLSPVKSEEGYTLRADVLSHLLHIGLVGGDFQDTVEPLHELRWLVEHCGVQSMRGRLDQFTAEAMSLLVELPGFDHSDMETLMNPIYERNKDDEERRRMIDAFSLDAYLVLGVQDKQEKVIEVLKTSRAMIFSTECTGCQMGLQSRVYLQMGEVEEALELAEDLFNGTEGPCLRSPRIPAAALLDYYLSVDALDEAEQFAEALAERIDYPTESGIKLANPLLEYYVRTGDYLEALEWVNHFGERMVRSPLMIQRRRFFQSVALLLAGLKGEGWTHLEARDLRFSVPVVLGEQGYRIDALREWVAEFI